MTQKQEIIKILNRNLANISNGFANRVADEIMEVTMRPKNKNARYVSYYKPFDGKHFIKIICHHCGKEIEEDTKVFVYVNGQDKPPVHYHIQCFYAVYEPIEIQPKA